jgi:hypothetical protein
MSKPIFHAIHFKTNACFDDEFCWRDEAGAVFDFSGCTARMQVRDVATGALILELTTVNGRIVLASTDPNIKLHVEETDLAALAEATGRWDMLILYPSGHTEAFPLEGSATISKGVTV